MKIWKNYKTKAAFLPMAKTRNCFMVCFHCERLWQRIQTEWVHMITTEKGKNFFVCDGCRDKINNEQK